MAKGRDDFVIAFRSAFLKKKDKQKFSLLTILFLSIFVIILSNFNFKIIEIVKLGINEVVYRSSFIVSIPENKIKKINDQIRNHIEFYDYYKDIELELENLKQNKLSNDFFKYENKKLRKLINENIKSDEILNIETYLSILIFSEFVKAPARTSLKLFFKSLSNNAYASNSLMIFFLGSAAPT